MNRREDFDGLDFYDHAILDNQISPESDINPNRPVDDWDGLLAHRPESTLSQFTGQHGVVNR